MTTVARLALVALCLVSAAAMDAMAHVRTPDFSRLDRNLDRVLPEADSRSRLEHRGEPKDVPVATRPVSGFARDTSRSPISEVGLHSMRAASEEILSLLDPTASDVIRVAQGATPDGAPCPLYVSIGAEGVARQTFWRFAPDDEPEGWFDEDGRRLGAAALAPPRPGSRMS